MYKTRFFIHTLTQQKNIQNAYSGTSNNLLANRSTWHTSGQLYKNKCYVIIYGQKTSNWSKAGHKLSPVMLRTAQSGGFVAGVGRSLRHDHYANAWAAAGSLQRYSPWFVRISDTLSYLCLCRHVWNAKSFALLWMTTTPIITHCNPPKYMCFSY